MCEKCEELTRNEKRELLGTIRIYRTENSAMGTSYCQTDHCWPPKEFDIVIDTTDKGDGSPYVPPTAQFKTHLCHELGHAVGMLAGDPVQHEVMAKLHGNVPAELDAWRNAEQIGPCDPARKASALTTYYQGESHRQKAFEDHFGELGSPKRQKLEDRLKLYGKVAAKALQERKDPVTAIERVALGALIDEWMQGKEEVLI